MTTFKKGDRVSVTGTIMYRPEAGKRVFVDIGEPNELYVSQESLTLVQPSFEVGDECTWNVDGGTNGGTILAISNGHAWVDMGDGDYCTRLLTSINRVDSYPEKVDSDD